MTEKQMLGEEVAGRQNSQITALQGHDDRDRHRMGWSGPFWRASSIPQGMDVYLKRVLVDRHILPLMKTFLQLHSQAFVTDIIPIGRDAVQKLSYHYYSTNDNVEFSY